jgi:hypothetical protein
MSSNDNLSVAEVLINAAVKVVGKREVLKAVEKLYGMKNPSNKTQSKSDVPANERCVARCKGDRTGMKVGRYVLFDNARCVRKGADNSQLCVIHSNQMEKFGSLRLGKFTEPLTEDLKKVFGDL